MLRGIAVPAVIGLIALTIPAGVQARQGSPAARPATVAAETPQALARLVLDRLVAGDMSAFTSVYPFSATMKEQATDWDVSIAADEPLVLRENEDEALLLLGAWPVLGNWGDETTVGRGFSGLYLARHDADGWRLDRALPPDAGNRIERQALIADIDPASGMHVVDTMTVDFGGAGFGATLNRRAEIVDVRVNGRTVPHAFAGGYLWVEVSPASHAKVVLDYRLPLAADTLDGANSGRFGSHFGHVRNQYFWHPFFDFGSQADRADFDVTVRAPSLYRIITDLPQTDSVQGGVRVVHARSERPTFALTLVYDDGVEARDAVVAGGTRVRLFLTPDSDPPSDSIMAAIRRSFRVLSDAFGPPQSRYLVVTQTRYRPGHGWSFRSNDMIAGYSEVGLADRDGVRPRAWLGHEISHGWTSPTGPGNNFLSEGWATYAESLLLGDRYGAETVADFWESQRVYYAIGGFDGQAKISDDASNSGIAYSKGAWILKMLQDRLGEVAFRHGMTAYMALPPGAPAGIAEFEGAMSKAAGHDIGAFLDPWVEGTHIPDLTATIEAGRILIRQEQKPVFLFDLDVDVVTAAGRIRRTVVLGGPTDTLSTAGLGEVEDIFLDPDHRLLIRRHRGEVVTFRLVAPEAKHVALNGSFLNQPLGVERGEDGAWTMTLPLSEGTYQWWWEVDGERRVSATGSRLVVEPKVRLDTDRLGGATR